jgi:MFS family permease
LSIYTVFAVVLCVMASFRGSKVLVSLFAIELGASQILIGILVALYSLFPMVLALYAGRLSDRLGVRRPMMLGAIGIALAMLLPFLWPTLTALCASAILIGASHVFYNVAAQSLIGGFGSPEARTKNFSNYGLVMSTGSFIGPLAAGFAIDHIGHAQAYLCLSLSPLIAAGIVFFAIRMKGKPGTGSEETLRTAGARELLTNVPLRRTLIAGGLVVTAVDLFQFYMPIYGHSIGLSASMIGVVLSLFAAASFVVRVALPSMAKRWGEARLFTWSLFSAAVLYLLFPLSTSAPLLAASAFGLGLMVGCCQPLSMTLVLGRAPQSRSGEALGLRLTVNNFTHVAVPLIFGTLGAAFGVAPVFVANSVMLACGGLVMRRR